MSRRSICALPAAKRTRAVWRRAEQQARNLLTHLRSAREFARILLKLQQMGHSRAAAFLASAMRIHGLARRWQHRGPFVVLAPTIAFEAAGFYRVPGDGMSAAEVRDMIDAHVAVVRSPKLIKGGSEVTTLAGRTFRLPEIGSRSSGDNLLVPVRTILYRQKPTGIHPQAAASFRRRQASSGLREISALSDAI